MPLHDSLYFQSNCRSVFFKTILLNVAIFTIAACSRPRHPEPNIRKTGSTVTDGCKKPDIALKIHNGQQATSEDTVAKYGVSVGGCSGSLISESFVLTAGHCVSPGAMVTVDFNQGIPDRVNEVSIQGMAIPHENFTQDRLSFDIALIKLQTPDLVPAEYATDLVIFQGDALDKQIATESVDAIISGYGRLRDDIANINNELHYATTQLLSLDNNLIYYESSDGMSAGCAGDSGGPVYVKDEQGRLTQVGIKVLGADSINGVPTCTTGKGYVTNVSRFFGWISDHLAAAGETINTSYDPVVDPVMESQENTTPPEEAVAANEEPAAETDPMGDEKENTTENTEKNTEKSIDSNKDIQSPAEIAEEDEEEDDESKTASNDVSTYEAPSGSEDAVAGNDDCD